jgi:site-specific DNA recombinase
MARGGNKPAQLRCAIYTRKSTEEGLDQEFNSLNAQREACAAYILSQRHEGWSLLPGHYDDGGFTGGNMDRPGLKRLLADVEAGRIDVIVVYKVDRLTRSLADFAKIVDVLDKAGASFVSITQSFNTTTSMGRLTLNVLLSFAQFEREVIAERVRDKIAASKAKGMWMGGPVPLGYDVQNRKLIVNEAEAETVRHIMRRYLELGSVRALLDDLRRSGIVTKVQTMRDGSKRGGLPFARGPLYHLLKNRIYRGEIGHKGQRYPGEHQASVDAALFDAVQAMLAANIGDRRASKHAASPSLLTGIIRDAAGRPMSPSHAVKAGRRYRYYASSENNDAPAVRLAAIDVEAAVKRSLADAIGSNQLGKDVASSVQLRKAHRERQTVLELLKHGSIAEVRALLLDIDLLIVAGSGSIEASCSGSRFAKQLGEAMPPTNARFPLSIQAERKRYGNELRLRLDAGPIGERDEKLSSLLIRASTAREQLQGADPDTLRPQQRRELTRLARASYLAPDIVMAILDGTQPKTLQARQLERGSALPINWNEQRRILGFARA